MIKCLLLILYNVATKTAFRIDSFNDIVENITHINSVLQEFIKNYRQLQDIYKSVELTAKDDVSEYVKRNKDSKYEETTKTTHPTKTTTQEPTITEVFYSEEHHWKETYDDNYYHDASPTKKNSSNVGFNLKSRHKTLTTLPNNIQTTKDKARRQPVTLSDISEENRETNELQESTDVEAHYSFNRPKTNQLIQSHETEERKDVRKVIKYETFDQDMWHSIIQSRPIRYEYPDIRRKSKYAKDKVALVILTNLKSPENKNIANSKLEGEIPEYSDTIYDDIVSSEIRMENAILRAKGKFGKACFQYVVRRCFMAQNEAGKKTCKDLGCKKSVKKSLKESAKESCQNEFYGQMEPVTTTTSAGRLRNATETNSTVKDLTRRILRRKHHHESTPNLGGGYLNTCYPHMVPAAKRRLLDSAELPESFLQAIVSAEIPAHSQEKSILRNKYERACKRESSKRCKKAGKKIIHLVCEKFPTECKKKTKHQYKKLSSKFCNEAFDVPKVAPAGSDYSCSSEDYTDDDDESDVFD